VRKNRQILLSFNSLRPSSKLVLRITAGGGRLGETSFNGRARPKRVVLGTAGSAAESGMGVMFTLLNRVFPLAGLAVALIATVAWMGLLGYCVSMLF